MFFIFVAPKYVLILIGMVAGGVWVCDPALPTQPNSCLVAVQDWHAWSRVLTEKKMIVRSWRGRWGTVSAVYGSFQTRATWTKSSADNLRERSGACGLPYTRTLVAVLISESSGATTPLFVHMGGTTAVVAVAIRIII